jgi:hypothetical protein
VDQGQLLEQPRQNRKANLVVDDIAHRSPNIASRELGIRAFSQGG